MHPVALATYSTSGDEVRADRIILRQIGREVHLLPLELFAQVIFPWEAKLSEMPSFDEVDLAISRERIDFVRVSINPGDNLIRIGLAIGLVVTQEECILFAIQPANLSRELKQTFFAHLDFVIVRQFSELSEQISTLKFALLDKVILRILLLALLRAFLIFVLYVQRIDVLCLFSEFFLYTNS